MPFSLLLIALLAHDGTFQVPERPTFADSVRLADQGRDSEALAAFQ